MKIIKYQKVSHNQYELTLDNNEKIKLYEDVILKEELLIKKEIKDLKKLLEINQKQEIYEVALKYLNKKMVSVKGMKEYLQRKNYSLENISCVLEQFIASNYLSNENYAKCYVHDKINLSMDGPYKIKKNLIKEEIDEEIINELLKIDDNIWYDKIEKYLEKQLKVNKQSVYCFKNKMMVNLINLGYEREMINHCLNELTFTNQNELKNREEIKIRKKLEKKYSGEELEYKIKEKLYQKGFFGGE